MERQTPGAPEDAFGSILSTIAGSDGEYDSGYLIFTNVTICLLLVDFTQKCTEGLRYWSRWFLR